MVFNLLRKTRDFIREVQTQKRLNRLPDGNIKDVNPNYKLTYDLLGIRNRNPIYCPHCKTTEMVIRSSRLHLSAELNELNPHIDLAFKCPDCDRWITFGIPIPKHYYLYIMQLRKKQGIGRMYAPTHEWNQKQEIKNRLEKLGYW